GVADQTRSGYRLQDMVDTLAELPLEFSPGTRWNYSVATDVVGHLIEVISGQGLDAYLRERVLAPLGMRDTSFVLGDQQVARFAANYERQGRRQPEDDRRPRPEQLPEAQLLLRGWRSPLDGTGLLPLHLDDAELGRARRRPAPRAQDGGAHDHE